MNFAASVNGHKILVKSVVRESRPRRIVILLDTSGSMIHRDGEGPLKWGLEFAKDFISSAPGADSLALMTFNNGIEEKFAFDQDRTVVLAEIEKLQRFDWKHVEGLRKTALSDALLNALDLLRDLSIGDAICLVTDGGENASHSRESEVIEHLVAAGVRVYAFCPTWFNGPDRQAMAQSSYTLASLAAATGGDLSIFVPNQARTLSDGAQEPSRVTVMDAAQIKAVSQGFHTEITTLDRMEIRLSEPIKRLSPFTLKVFDDSGHSAEYLEIRHPSKLAPCLRADR